MIHTRDSLLNAIQRCLDKKGLSLREMARQSGVTYDSLKDFKWGRTQMLRGDNLQKIVMLLGDSLQPMIPIVGYVGAGGEIYSVDDHSQGAAMEEVECPPGVDPSTTVALRIRGDSMHPVFQNGWIVYYSERLEIAAPPIKKDHLLPGQSDNLERFYGKPCVVKLRDGRVLLKTLKRGAEGRHTLSSYNAPDMENAAIEWATRIIFVKIT